MPYSRCCLGAPRVAVPSLPLVLLSVTSRSPRHVLAFGICLMRQPSWPRCVTIAAAADRFIDTCSEPATNIWQYVQVRRYPTFNDTLHPEDGKPFLLPKVLCHIDPDNFPSLSQARKAVKHRRILITRPNDNLKTSIGETNSTLQNDDIISVRRRVDNPHRYYPQSVTGFCDPPPDVFAKMPIDVLFENSHIAVVNKPESLDTIGQKRGDLQSMLPFILRPPTSSASTPLQLPRSVHRLDRATSGCVLVAKTKESMRRYSQMFASRDGDGIRKSYVAIVFGIPKLVDDSATTNHDLVQSDGKSYGVVDYPIDNKDAVTLWRTVATSSSSKWGTISLVHLIPKTGRMHQIRRHLRYCLGCSIVGDPKYVGGIDNRRAKSARKMGLFLCSNSIRIPSRSVFECERSEAEEDGVMGEKKMTNKNGRRMISVKMQLPEKFHSTMGVDIKDLDV